MAKILIVDDSNALRSQLRKDLEGHGHSVIEAADGHLGIQQMEQNPDVSLVICDSNMPSMDGVTMCERLHQVEAFSKIPKFMLTTEASPLLKQKAKAAGVVAWIIKPYSTDKLLAAIGKVLQR